MKRAQALRRGTLVAPGLFAAVSVVIAPAPFAIDAFIGAVFTILLLMISVVLHSDGGYLFSFGAGSSALALTSWGAGPLVGTGVAVALLVSFDLAWLARGVFGVAEERFDPDDGEAVSRYMGLIRDQAWRSALVGTLAFAVTVAVLSTPIPILKFGNPVSGTGLLALAALLLALLAGTNRKAVREVLRLRRKTPEA
jgi:hypothetical protein